MERHYVCGDSTATITKTDEGYVVEKHRRNELYSRKVYPSEWIAEEILRRSGDWIEVAA